MGLSKENDKWLDDNSFCAQDTYGGNGVTYVLEESQVESKLLELELKVKTLESQVNYYKELTKVL